MTLKVIGTLITAFFFAGLSAAAQEHAPGGETDRAPLFSSDALLVVTIEAPLTTLMKERPDEEYLEGRFRIVADDGTERTLDLKLRTRGNYRREKKHCNFAPIRLNFRKHQVAGTVLDGQDKLKMVTHCQNRMKGYEQLVLREYLAYRILNELTSSSFGVRLLRITYIDTEGGKPRTKFGFVIEDADDVAARNAMTTVETGNIQDDEVDPLQQNLINVFQYMIGNTEYSLSVSEPDDDCCHNSGLMSATGGPPFTPLAYDFDFAGMVNAPYAEPNPKYKNLRSVRQRLYKGLCKNNDLLPQTLQRFLDKKEAIYGIVNELEPLNSVARRSIIYYLNAFYSQISEPRLINSRFIDKCNDSR